MVRGNVRAATLFPLFSRSFSKIDFGMHFGCPLAPFWLPFGSVWTPFGTIWHPLVAFWLPLAPCWLRSVFLLAVGSRWLHLGSRAVPYCSLLPSFRRFDSVLAPLRLHFATCRPSARTRSKSLATHPQKPLPKATCGTLP